MSEKKLARDAQPYGVISAKDAARVVARTEGVKLSEALETVAARNGWRNWSTMRAMSSAERQAFRAPNGYEAAIRSRLALDASPADAEKAIITVLLTHAQDTDGMWVGRAASLGSAVIRPLLRAHETRGEVFTFQTLLGAFRLEGDLGFSGLIRLAAAVRLPEADALMSAAQSLPGFSADLAAARRPQPEKAAQQFALLSGLWFAAFRSLTAGLSGGKPDLRI